MFRSFNGYKSRYHNLTLLVISEFNEWKVLVYGDGVTLHGQRQFVEQKALEHAADIARNYVHEMKHEEAEPSAIEWQPSSPEDWLAWRN